MIRTAILAGILLVMLSMAYTRQSLPIVQSTALLEQPQVKAVAHAAKSAKAVAPVEAQAEPAPRPITKEELAPAPALAPKVEVVAAAPQPAPPAPVVEAPVVAPSAPALAAPAPAEAPAQVAAPRSLLPPATPVQAQIAEAPARPLVPLIPPADSAPVAQTQVAKLEPKPEPPRAEDMPTIAVAKPRVFAPTEIDLPANPHEPVIAQGSIAAPAADASARPTQPAPKFMTPQERSRDLYRLAREMEDTFLGKLAR